MKIRIAAVLLLISSALWAQNRTLSGYITDFETGEALIGVNVWAPELKLGTSSNNYGFYSLTLPKGTHVVRLTYLGYDNNQFEVDLSKNVDFDFRLKPSDNMLNEVDVVAAEGQKIQEQVQMSKMEVPIKQLKSLPAILGEVDIMKTLQLLPGVQSGGEGTSGLYVRVARRIKTSFSWTVYPCTMSTTSSVSSRSSMPMPFQTSVLPKVDSQRVTAADCLPFWKST